MDIEGSSHPSWKRSLTATVAVSAEWKSGSKKRVIKYYMIYAVIGLIIGAIISVVIGECVRFAWYHSLSPGLEFIPYYCVILVSGQVCEVA